MNLAVNQVSIPLQNGEGHRRRPCSGSKAFDGDGPQANIEVRVLMTVASTPEVPPWK